MTCPQIARVVIGLPESTKPHMRAMVGFMFFLLFLACIALITLMGRQTTLNAAPGSSWRPVKVGIESMPEDSGMFITFESHESIKGHGGCNGFFGPLKKTKSRLIVGPLGSTRKACDKPTMDQEAKFLEILHNTKTFRVARGRMLSLNEEGQPLAEFVLK